MIPLRRLLPLLFAPALAGCFDLTEEVWVQPDGTDRLRVDLQLSELLSSVASGGKGADDAASLGSDFERLARELEADKEKVKSARASDFKEGVHRHLVLDVGIARDEFFNEISDRILRSGKAAGEKAGGGKSPAAKKADRQPRLRLEAAGGRSLRFSCPTREPADEAGSSGGLGEQLLKTVWGDRLFTVRLHAPSVVSANGAIDGSGELVEWKYPFVDVMVGKETVPPVLTAEVRRKPGPLFWLAVAAVGLFLLVGLPRLFRGRSAG